MEAGSPEDIAEVLSDYVASDAEAHPERVYPAKGPERMEFARHYEFPCTNLELWSPLERVQWFLGISEMGAHILDAHPPTARLDISCVLAENALRVTVVDLDQQEERLKRLARRAICQSACIAIITILKDGLQSRHLARLVARELWTHRRSERWGIFDDQVRLRVKMLKTSSK
jgi:hypothetical protein